MSKILKNYILTLLNTANETDIIEDELEEFDTYYEEDMMKELNMLTVISKTDNPNMDLSVAQPSKYKIKKSGLGTGIVCYPLNAISILKQTIEPDEIILTLKIDIDENKCLDLCTYRHKEYVKEIYNTISDKSIIKDDNDFIDYVCRKGSMKVDTIMAILPLGDLIYPGSILPDYIGKCIIIRNENIIESANKI